MLICTFAGCCCIAESNSSLPAQLFREADWIACRTECKRLILSGHANDYIKLLDAVAGIRSGTEPDNIGRLKIVCESPTASQSVKSFACYEYGRVMWQKKETQEAFVYLKKAFETAEARDLFIRAGCSLHLLIAEYPELASQCPHLPPQLETCADLWDYKIVNECKISNKKNKEAITGKPAQWAISFYRSHISPAIGQRCSLTPSCSEYANQALKKYGAMGLSMFADRAVREPDVVAQKEHPVLVNNDPKYSDPLRNHTKWLDSSNYKTMSAPKVIDHLIASLPQSENSPNKTTSINNTTRQLALLLDREHHHKEAALEFRRIAITNDNNIPDQQSGYYWAAAYEYWQCEDTDSAMAMLDISEACSSSLATESLFLRGIIAYDNRQYDEAGFYLEGASNGSTETNLLTFTSRTLAQISMVNKDTENAVRHLNNAPSPDTKGINAVQDFALSSDKSPSLGGWLGTVPGLGYAYSGEYANALRSVILNGLFIYAMSETADNGQWGIFSAVTFFEITWYTGSIYGGIDSAHRYNERRLSTCLNTIRGNSKFTSNVENFPAISLKFSF